MKSRAASDTRRRPRSRRSPSPTRQGKRYEIAAAAKALVEFRAGWLNPPGLTEDELRTRTLTKLYNQWPSWLAHAHERLDRAVHAAYGWEYPLDPEDVLARLVALNLERSSPPSVVATARV